ncbi:hypothetical protein AV530_015408 [Patagioenas fasciata monilis]|uniref:Uncharacterized protein n=1 Tax=Patagioenas fasciata monilis TaxID=372326 RepID=A0A1V4JV80_PATFA|nr:hypothetical protein AV530_015408 [Patagioenas fasciata monilis]
MWHSGEPKPTLGTPENHNFTLLREIILLKNGFVSSITMMIFDKYPVYLVAVLCNIKENITEVFGVIS